MTAAEISVEQHQGYWRGRFKAMASPCEILMEVDSLVEAEALTLLAQREALRIEQKFSRYRTDNIIYRINHSQGLAIDVDQETAGLLDYASQCYQLSDGSFDITSGVLREVWKFDGSDRVPSKKAVKVLLSRIGWDKIKWHSPSITLPKGMEIDLGGIGKEYAVDRTALLIKQKTNASVLLNFGGDLFANKPRRNGSGWIVGIENPQHSVQTNPAPHDKISLKDYELTTGAIATSGDAFRYLLKNDVRYSHILDPRTGWPVSNAPRSITVAAGTCTEAGILATLAMLQGGSAKQFLKEQDVMFWIIQ